MPATKKPAKPKPAAKPAATKPAKPVKVPARKAAEIVLLQNGKPMHYREITRVAVEQGIVKVPKGKRVNADKTMKTMRSFLAGSAKDGDKFVRVDDGVFDLTPAARKALEAEAS